MKNKSILFVMFQVRKKGGYLQVSCKYCVFYMTRVDVAVYQV